MFFNLPISFTEGGINLWFPRLRFCFAPLSHFSTRDSPCTRRWRGDSHLTNTGSSATASFNVTSVQPASGATGVAINAPITVTFSGAANASSVTTTHISLTGTSAVAGTVAWDSANNTATFTCRRHMYALKVAGVTSSTGVALSSAFKSTFTTLVPSASATTQFTVPLFATDVGH